MPPLARTAAAALLFVAALSGHPAVAHDDATRGPCFDADARGGIELALPRLMIETDQLAVRRAQAGAPGLQVYFMARQTLLLERMARRLASLDDGGCGSALDAIGRDFRMLERMTLAFRDGHAGLEIDKLEDAAAQAALASIAGQVAQLAPQIAALGAKE